jgi:S-adenosylmethionine hydrolase
VSAPVVTFLSDYGYRDEFVGVCHGVIASRCPAARIIDITHGIALGDIHSGALALRAALPHMPAGVHLAVVDPGVGGKRRAIALSTATEGHTLVGPDNGLLVHAAEALGGVRDAYDIAGSPVASRTTTTTFDGRDLFAPVAAALASGTAPGELGKAIAASSLVALELPAARRDGAILLVPVISVDGYGNLELAAFELGTGVLTLELGGHVRDVQIVRAFSDVPPGELLAHVDSRGAPAIAENGGSAAARLGLAPGDLIRVRL